MAFARLLGSFLVPRPLPGPVMETKAFGFGSFLWCLYRAYAILSIFIAIHIEVNYELLFNVTMKLFNYFLSASKHLSSKGFRQSGMNAEEVLGNHWL